MKCKRCQAVNARGAITCWACGVRMAKRRDRQMAFRPEAMRHYQTSVAAMSGHHAWLDGIVLLSTIAFGLLLGYFLLDVLPQSGARGSISAAGAAAAPATSRLGISSLFGLLAPAPEVRPLVPVGQPQEVKGIVSQVAEPRRSKAEGGRQAANGAEFLVATVVIDNQSTAPFSYSLNDLKLRDSKGRVHNAENIRGAGWLSGGSIEPGQRVQGIVAFLEPEGDPQPQVTFAPNALKVMLRWGIAAAS